MELLYKKEQPHFLACKKPEQKAQPHSKGRRQQHAADCPAKTAGFFINCHHGRCTGPVEQAEHQHGNRLDTSGQHAEDAPRLAERSAAGQQHDEHREHQLICRKSEKKRQKKRPT